jgi:hypothetical protein
MKQELAEVDRAHHTTPAVSVYTKSEAQRYVAEDSEPAQRDLAEAEVKTGEGLVYDGMVEQMLL